MITGTMVLMFLLVMSCRKMSPTGHLSEATGNKTSTSNDTAFNEYYHTDSTNILVYIQNSNSKRIYDSFPAYHYYLLYEFPDSARTYVQVGQGKRHHVVLQDTLRNHVVYYGIYEGFRACTSQWITAHHGDTVKVHAFAKQMADADDHVIFIGIADSRRSPDPTATWTKNSIPNHAWYGIMTGIDDSTATLYYVVP